MIERAAVWLKPMVLCSLFVVVGTAIAQRISGRVDVRSLARFGVYGLIKGAINFAWFSFLNRQLPGTELKAVLTKVLLDQVIFTPVGGYLPFFTIMAFLEGRGLAAGLVEVRDKTPRLLSLGWRTWPVVHIANFLVVPASMQIYVIWTAGVIWNTIQALVCTRPSPSEKEA